ncbi:MAG: penicillin-binding protein [Lachnospiraceae bacterium]|nr:penicillin-binding protein [Lachnospiraceae bacterium]
MDYSRKGVRDRLKDTVPTSDRLKNKVVITLVKCLILAVLFAGFSGLAAGIGVMRGIIYNAPRLNPDDVAPDGFMTTVYDAEGNVIEKLVRSGSNRSSVAKYEDLPKNLVNAFVAVEDSRFWTHNGIDIKGILRAGSVALTHGGLTEGGSTITQQLLKNNVFTNWMEENSFGSRVERKLQEQYLAMELEKQMSKELILLNYLNSINLGNNTLGVKAATQRYFNKEVQDLTLSECAVLAAITKSPTRYDPIRNPEENDERRRKVLKDMYDQEYISQEEWDEALADPVYDRIAAVNNSRENTNSIYSYYVDELIEQVIADLQSYRGYTESQAYNLLYSGGLQIYTAMDPKIQQIIDEEVNNEDYYPATCTQYACTCVITLTKKDGSVENYTENDVKRYFRTEKEQSTFKLVRDTKEELDALLEEFCDYISRNGGEAKVESIDYTLQPQVSFVVIEQSTGCVRGICGGRGEKTYNLSLNRATNTPRQPGSLFKVLATFTPALDIQGDTLGTVYYDGPYSIGEKTYSNYWGNIYTGYSNIRQAIVYSMNIVATRCLVDTVNPTLAYEYLLNYGFTTLVDSRVEESGAITSDINPSLGLGGLTDGVTNLETTAAYAAIANGGVYTKPIFYTKILDNDGNVLIDNQPETRTVMKESTAFLLTNAMEETMDGGLYPMTNPSGGIAGTGKAADVAGMSIAGKTGTTTSTYDTWFAGYSPYYTATIWTGYDENQTIRLSESYHKRIWSAIMTRIHEDLPDIGFPTPSGIETATICRKSGKLAVEGVCDQDPRGSMTYQEYFAKGSVPKTYCDVHTAATICAQSGQLATDGCPFELRQRRTYMVLPADDTGSTDDSLYALPAGSCILHAGNMWNGLFPNNTEQPENPANPPTTDNNGNNNNPAGNNGDNSNVVDNGANNNTVNNNNNNTVNSGNLPGGNITNPENSNNPAVPGI